MTKILYENKRIKCVMGNRERQSLKVKLPYGVAITMQLRIIQIQDYMDQLYACKVSPADYAEMAYESTLQKTARTDPNFEHIFTDTFISYIASGKGITYKKMYPAANANGGL